MDKKLAKKRKIAYAAVIAALAALAIGAGAQTAAVALGAMEAMVKPPSTVVAPAPRVDAEGLRLAAKRLGIPFATGTEPLQN